MKTDESNTVAKPTSAKAAGKADPKKQKKQLIMLSGLAVVLVAVVFIQFGGSEPRFEAAALADITLDDPDGSGSDGGAAVAAPPVARDNPVLLKSDEDDGLLRNAFSNFWDTASADERPMVEITPPSITLSGTMPDAGRAIAIIDGRIHFVGDSIDGWKLSEIRPRAVVLTGPANASIVVDMPVIFGRVTVPEALQIPGRLTAEHAGDSSSGDPEDG